MNFDSFILYLHRVGERNYDQIISNRDMVITPEELDTFINKYNKKYKFLSLDELNDNFNRKIIPNKVLHLTFDDGYLDNYNNAYPILKYYNIPFTIYLTTSFIDSNFTPWWYELENVVNNNLEVFFDNILFKCRNTNERNDTFIKIRKIAFSSNYKMNYFLDFLKQYRGFSNLQPLYLTWDIVKMLSNDNNVLFGAHTDSHANLSLLSHEESESEILNSKFKIEKILQKEIVHFAYPFGGPNNYNQLHIDILSNNNFCTSVTTKYGFLNSSCLHNRHELPRIMLGPDFFSIKRRVHRSYYLNFK